MKNEPRTNQAAMGSAIQATLTSIGAIGPRFKSLGLKCEQSLLLPSIPKQFIRSLWRSPELLHVVHRFGGWRGGDAYVAESEAEALKALGEWLSEGAECLMEYCEYAELSKPDWPVMKGSWALWINIPYLARGGDCVWVARDALSKFRDDTRLPRPNHVIDTGDQLQAVWIFDRLLSREVWQRAAEGLLSLAEAHNLSVDTDEMWLDTWHRMPGSLNLERSWDPRPVILLESNSSEAHSWPNMRRALSAALKSAGKSGRPLKSLPTKTGGDF